MSKHGFHIARHALHDNGSDGHERAIFFRDREDAVFLCEKEGDGESLVLGAGQGTNDTTISISTRSKVFDKGLENLHVHLKERIKHIHKVGL